MNNSLRRAAERERAAEADPAIRDQSRTQLGRRSHDCLMAESSTLKREGEALRKRLSGGGSPDDSIPEGARPDGGSATAGSAGSASAAGVRRRQHEWTWLSGALHLDVRQCWCMTSTFFRAFMSFSLGCCRQRDRCCTMSQALKG